METNQEILHAAYRAWMGCGNLRARRARCKAFTYGDQWCDTYTDAQGITLTEGQPTTRGGAQPLTNNLLRQLVRTVVGRYRSQMIDEVKPKMPFPVIFCAQIAHISQLYRTFAPNKSKCNQLWS